MSPPRPLALVTGAGRRQGIGAAVVARLAGDGWDVAWTYWSAYDSRMPWRADPAAVGELQRAVVDAGGRGFALEADLTDPAEPGRIFDGVLTSFGRPPRALVMCHCESVDSGLLDTTVDSFDRHYAVNLRASWLLVREFGLRFPPGEPDGRLIAMTSDATVGNLPYGATKGGLDRLVVSAARELAHLRITANVINPGPTDTGWMSAELLRTVRELTPLNRIGQPLDAANLVSFLCSPAGGWVNGQLLHSDGGVGTAPV